MQQQDVLMGPFGINLEEGRVYGGVPPAPGELIPTVSVPLAFLDEVAGHVRVAEKVDALCKSLGDRLAAYHLSIDVLCRACEGDTMLPPVTAELSPLLERIQALRTEPRPLEQALATLAQHWHAAIQPPEPPAPQEHPALTARRAGFDAYNRDEPLMASAQVRLLPDSWREGWLMAQNGEVRP